MENKDLFTTETDKSLLTAFAWWEKRRWIFNLLVGITGLLFVFQFTLLTGLDYIGIIMYGIIANLFYCLGFLIEIGTKHYLKKDIDFSKKRNGFFIAGLFFSVIVTAVIGYIYCFVLSMPFLD